MQKSGAEILWECLVREGVDTVFGLPGGSIMPVYDVMLNYPIRHGLVKHEQGAAHMADGYARASGKVGVAIATSGPGATNLVTGIATAMLDSSPIVCITGQVPAHLVGAGMLVILTDTEGLFSDDPRLTTEAQLLSAVEHNDGILDRIRKVTHAGALGSGGVATKVTAARMAAFSGIPTVIASAGVPNVVVDAVGGVDVGTWIAPRLQSLPARKLWIAFGLPSTGSITVDDGAVDAIRAGGASLLAVGLTETDGEFSRGDAVEVVDGSGALVAKGISRFGSDVLSDSVGRHSDAIGGEVIHRDDLVVLR